MTDQEKLEEIDKIITRSEIKIDRFVDTLTRDGFDLVDEDEDEESDNPMYDNDEEHVLCQNEY